MVNFLTDVASGSKSVKDALKDMLTSFIKGLADSAKEMALVILKMEIMKALGLGGGEEKGEGKSWWSGLLGSIGGLFASGGSVVGPSGVDRVPIRATSGEFVHPVSAVEYYGEGVMEAMRRRMIPKDLLRGFAFGPSLHPAGAYAAGGAVSGGSSVSVSVPVNVSDPRLASNLRSRIEDIVVRTLKEYSR